MTGFRVRLVNVKVKTDPVTGKTLVERVHKLDASKRKAVHAKASKSAKKWQAKNKVKP